ARPAAPLFEAERARLDAWDERRPLLGERLDFTIPEAMLESVTAVASGLPPSLAPRAHFLAARAHALCGRPREALRELDTAAPSGPLPAEHALERALATWDLLLFERAFRVRDRIEEGMRTCREQLAIATVLGDVPKEHLSWMRDALSLESGDLDALSSRARALAEKDPERTAVRERLLGDRLLLERDLAKAALAYDASLAARDNVPQAVAGRCFVALELARNGDAAESEPARALLARTLALAPEAIEATVASGWSRLLALSRGELTTVSLEHSDHEARAVCDAPNGRFQVRWAFSRGRTEVRVQLTGSSTKGDGK
ncbi:hypothetical protein HY251_13485, partial [bacterium]|nr:hypothetical protein [bacterium]